MDTPHTPQTPEIGTLHPQGGEDKTPEGIPAVIPPAIPAVVTPTVPAVPATPPQEDFRGKFGESTRNNQVLMGQLEELNRRLGEVTKEEIPTDEEIVREYPEFEFASETEKSIMKRQVVLDRRMKGVQMSVGTMLFDAKRRDQLAGVAATNPALKGKEERFFDFASHPSRKDTPADVLVNAFLYEVRDEAPATPPLTPQTSPATPEGQPQPAAPAAPSAPEMPLERGTPSGGEAPSAPSTERTPEELKALRTSDPKEYQRLIREGKI